MEILRITADDFGLSHEVNEAVERDFEAGILHGAGLMIGGPAAEEALRIAKRHPGLRVGLHLVLCLGPGCGEREMRAGPAFTGLRLAFDPGFARILKRECEAQIAAFCALGLPPGQLDGHCHLHLHPKVFPWLVEQAGKFSHVRLLRPPPYEKGMLPSIFRALSKRAARLAPQWASPDFVFGLSETGQVSTSTLLRWIEQAGQVPGEVEIYYHPGNEPEALEPGPVREALILAASRNSDQPFSPG